MADKSTTSSSHQDNGSDGEELSPAQTQKLAKPSLMGKFFNFLRSRNGENNDSEKLIDESLLTPQQRLMLENLMELHEARVADVMIPRSEIEAIDIDTSLADTLKFFDKSGHSRMPVYAETLDDPRGMIHIRDILNYMTRTAQTAVENGPLDLGQVDLTKTIGEIGVIRDVLFVPDSMLASQLLSRMQTTRTQMALVIDEHGGTDGLASMEDVFEMVVGDIEDEHDDDDVMIVKEEGDSWIVDARTDLEELTEIIGEDMHFGDLVDEVDTIGGFIVTVLDRIPLRGETIEAVIGFSFQILEADRRRIRRIKIKRLATDI
ncbi:hemolysin family protein [Bartonella sp. HY329]|uniref:transporter associated domain-containing protein n=1 Tax=unclassified Bartonella TaxID=2645622 RepID=UPI0021C99A0C|nr:MULTISPECIES: hemolysin family protein [unclassified Bartonella]UXM95763.1 hemolysin family protein [Bartonella sp. HY329]UXN10088.1 hemolysin family protein [Bartonella sp. HY328]